MPDLFVALSPAARREQRASYYQFLLARDGALDVEKRTLSHREEGMVRYSKALPSVRQLDRKLFEDQYAAFDASIPTPPEVLLLLALVKVNAAEAYGVNTNFDKALRKLTLQGDPLELTLLVEELYHTRILLSSAVLYGMEINAPYKPSTGLRALIHGIGHSPEFLSRALTLAGEIMGTLFFLELLGKAGQILRHDAELRDAIEERLCEIMIDEIGHISFNRMLLGSGGLALARSILPLVATALSGAIPEVAVLGALPTASESDLTALATGRGLPEHVRRVAFLA
jgi:hypothetical protein